MLSKTVLAIVALSALLVFYFSSIQVKSINDAEDIFSKFILENRRSYFSKDEYKVRFNIFKNTLSEIDKLNANPNDEATYAINFMADWTKEEKNHI